MLISMSLEEAREMYLHYNNVPEEDARKYTDQGLMDLADLDSKDEIMEYMRDDLELVKMELAQEIIATN